jgi:Tol biopolymer transport system component
MTSPVPPEDDLSSPQPGSLVGHYRILGEIGRGGMGVVYRALDVNLEREVALKCPRPDLAGDAKLLRRFLHEARTVSRLSHPNIIPVYEVFEEGGHPWLASELVDGEDLRAALQRRGLLPVEEVLVHAEGLTDALNAAHSKGILHRDIKPGNVLIGKDGRARLADFGLAGVFASGTTDATTRSASLTGEGHVVGTPGYMSPEQVLGKPLDARSDIFSLGVVLYEMCTGHPAFAGSGQGDWMDALLHREPSAISRYNYDVPEELERIVRKSLAKRPDERYQHASEMHADLRALRRKVESGDDLSADRRKVRRLRPRGIIAGAATGIAVAVVLAGWFWIHGSGPRPLPKGQPRQLTSSPGTKGEPALSPDDGFVAYSSDETGNPEIWLMDLKSGAPLRLTDHPGADTSPAWLPDGSALLFVSDRGGSPSIYKIPRLGGTPLLVVPGSKDPAVSPDGTRVAFARPDASGDTRIGVAPLRDPGRATILTDKSDGVWSHCHPAWSPDGTKLCFEDFRDLWIVPANGGKVTPLTTDHQWNLEPEWSPDGRFVYYSSYREGTHALWRVPASGGTPERVTLGTGPEGHPSIARSGTRLAYSTYVSEDTISLLDLRSGRRTRLPSLRRANEPAISRDRSRLVFLSDRLGRSDLWSQSLRDGLPQGEPVRVAEQPGHVGTFSLSPDGRWIAYHGHIEGRRDIWILPSEGGPATKVTDSGTVNVQPAWSPDGKRLAYVSNAEGNDQIWIAPVENGRLAGRAVRLSSDDWKHSFPCWSPDGSWIAFLGLSASSSEVWIVRSDGPGPSRRVTSGAEAKQVRWDRSTGDLLVSGAWGTEHTEIRRVSPADGASSPLKPPVVFGDAAAAGSFGVSWDGSLIAYDQEAVRGEIWVLEVTRGSY